MMLWCPLCRQPVSRHVSLFIANKTVKSTYATVNVWGNLRVGEVSARSCLAKSILFALGTSLKITRHWPVTQGPRQIARRKRQETERKKNEWSTGNPGQDAQITDENDIFYASHMAQAENQIVESAHFLSSSWSRNSWIADSGASSHIANQREMFIEYTPINGTLNVAGGMTARIEGTGTVIMRGTDINSPKNFKLTNVLYVSSTRHCLLSGPRLDQAGGEATFKDGMCQFRNCK